MCLIIDGYHWWLTELVQFMVKYFVCSLISSTLSRTGQKFTEIVHNSRKQGIREISTFGILTNAI